MGFIMMSICKLEKDQTTNLVLLAALKKIGEPKLMFLRKNFFIKYMFDQFRQKEY